MLRSSGSSDFVHGMPMEAVDREKDVTLTSPWSAFSISAQLILLLRSAVGHCQKRRTNSPAQAVSGKSCCCVHSEWWADCVSLDSFEIRFPEVGEPMQAAPIGDTAGQLARQSWTSQWHLCPIAFLCIMLPSPPRRVDHVLPAWGVFLGEWSGGGGGDGGRQEIRRS